MLTVAVLGPVDLRRDGVRLSVPAGLTTEVLIRLALDAGRPVRAERLIDDLWPAGAVGVARNSLQAKVSKLRRVLGDPALVFGGPGGYALHVEPSAVDALEALRLAEIGNAAGRDLFTSDEILPDAGSGAWLDPWRARLTEARLRLTEAHVAARLETGGAVIGELEALVAAHPLREGLWRLLITALYRDGRQGDALAAYRRAGERIADELGVDPGPELRALERRILVQDEALAPPVGNLPALTASLVGREADLAAVNVLIGRGRLVTLTGPAGVGKTRLALEVARRGGGWLIRLDTISAGSVAGGAASGGGTAYGMVVGLLWQLLGEAFAMAEANRAMVLGRLRGLRTLIVLDNGEHLIGPLGSVVEDILGAAPGVTLLATSQAPLGKDGELRYAVEPLAPDAAATLFRERASRHRRIEPGEDVAAVCRALDGLPLAIELAAARAKVLSVPEIAHRLDDRFPVLTDPNRDGPARRRTLRGAIGWSYELLFPDDQRGLQALSCFASAAPLAAAEHVLAALGVPGPAALDVLDRLVDRSLAIADVAGGGVPAQGVAGRGVAGEGGAGSGVAGEDVAGAGAVGEVRYRLLDSVRAYGRERLRESRLVEVAAAAHASWYAAAATRAGRGLRGVEQARHLAFVRAERADIDAAIAWAVRHDPLVALRIVNGFGWAWVFLGVGSEAARRSREVLAAAGPAATAVDRADALLFAGWFEACGGDLERAFGDVDLAHTVTPLPRTWLFRAFLHSQQGRPAEALDALDAFRAAGGVSGDPDGWEIGAGRLLEAWAAIGLGDTARAHAACADALRLLVPLGDAWALSHAEALLGGLAQAEHRHADAVGHLTRAAEAAHRLGFSAAEALHLANRGRAQQLAGDPDGALDTLRRSAAAALHVGDLRGVAFARTRRARVLLAGGRRAEARAELRAARAWYESAGGGDGDLLSAQLAAALDDDQPALERVLARARATGDHEVELLTLDALARLYAAAGDAESAKAMAAAADALVPAAAHLVTPADRLDRAALDQPGPETNTARRRPS